MASDAVDGGRVAGHGRPPVAGGDLAVGGRARRRRPPPGVVDRPWTWLRQVHGAARGRRRRARRARRRRGRRGGHRRAGVRRWPCTPPTAPGRAGQRRGRGRRRPRRLAGPGRRRGRADGRGDARPRRRPCAALLGPCIHPGATSSAPTTSTRSSAALGDEVRGARPWGTPALDLPAGVAPPRRGRRDDVDDAGDAAPPATPPVLLVPGPRRRAAARPWSSGVEAPRRRRPPRRSADRRELARRAWPSGAAPASRRAGGDPGAVRLVAVTKGFGADAVAPRSAPGWSTSARTTPRSWSARPPSSAGAADRGAALALHRPAAAQQGARARAATSSVWQSVDRRRSAPRSPSGRRAPRCWCRSTRAARPQKGGCPPDDVAALVDRPARRSASTCGGSWRSGRRAARGGAAGVPAAARLADELGPRRSGRWA